VSDDNENHPDAKRKISGARREKAGKQTYAARVLGDLKLVKENRDMRDKDLRVKSEVSEDMRKRLGGKVKHAVTNDNSEDDEKKMRMKRRMKLDSPVKSKSRKVEKPKAVKSIKKSSKRSVEVDDESSDEEKFKNLKITKAANTSSDLNKSESSALNSSKDYAPIRNRKIKLKKKKKGSDDMSDVSSLLALDTSQEAVRDEPDGDILKQLDDFINE